MSLKGGYWGKIAWINLTAQSVRVDEFREEFAKKYLGGGGFGIKLVSDVVTGNVDPLSPRNVLVFSTDPYQAASIASAGRWSACSRSPLTGYWGESNASHCFEVGQSARLPRFFADPSGSRKASATA